MTYSLIAILSDTFCQHLIDGVHAYNGLVYVLNGRFNVLVRTNSLFQ